MMPPQPMKTKQHKIKKINSTLFHFLKISSEDKENSKTYYIYKGFLICSIFNICSLDRTSGKYFLIIPLDFCCDFLNLSTYVFVVSIYRQIPQLE